MSGTVPTLSLAFMAVSCAVAFLVPFGLMLYFHYKKKADIWPFFAGCLIMLVFAFVLERLAHSVILSSDIGREIQRHIWPYAVYGGLMAGIFEESGRFIAFHTILRKYLRKDSNALMYGAGHGGLEAIVLLGITSITNIAFSVLINAQQTDLITSEISGDSLKSVQEAFQALISTPSLDFLMGSVERLSAIVLQIAFSVLVWFAVKKKKKVWLYLLAILLHAAVDAATVVLADRGISIPVLEGIIAASAVVCALIAWGVWKKETSPYSRLDRKKTQ